MRTLNTDWRELEKRAAVAAVFLILVLVLLDLWWLASTSTLSSDDLKFTIAFLAPFGLGAALLVGTMPYVIK